MNTGAGEVEVFKKIFKDYEKSTWYDEYLQWDPAEFDYTTSIWVPEELIWIPDITMSRGLNVNPAIPLEKRKVVISHTGKVKMYSPSIVNHYCKMGIQNGKLHPSMSPLKIGQLLALYFLEF
uniref:Neurotransmitter-gated ion-channel ligand-binding domain-containing protein n=1 Tax=Plectus sambesii TaxID=2011161 RepID=A0A914WM06_9BILA